MYLLRFVVFLNKSHIEDSEMDLFYFYCRHNGAVSHQQQLLLLLPSLRQADHIIRKFWIQVYREGSVNMKKLFVEMLESVSK